nr:unnamed protein product [Digitaria exilis]
MPHAVHHSATGATRRWAGVHLPLRPRGEQLGTRRSPRPWCCSTGTCCCPAGAGAQALNLLPRLDKNAAVTPPQPRVVADPDPRPPDPAVGALDPATPAVTALLAVALPDQQQPRPPWEGRGEDAALPLPSSQATQASGCLLRQRRRVEGEGEVAADAEKGAAARVARRGGDVGAGFCSL